MSLHSYTVNYECWNHRNRFKKKTRRKNNVCSESVFSLFSFARYFYRSQHYLPKRAIASKNILASLARRKQQVTNDYKCQNPPDIESIGVGLLAGICHLLLLETTFFFFNLECPFCHDLEHTLTKTCQCNLNIIKIHVLSQEEKALNVIYSKFLPCNRWGNWVIESEWFFKCHTAFSWHSWACPVLEALIFRNSRHLHLWENRCSQEALGLLYLTSLTLYSTL